MTDDSVISDLSMIEVELQAFLRGYLASNELLIVYDDLHPFHGGLRLTIDGTGTVTQEAELVQTKNPGNLTHEQILELIQLLLKLEAWQQRVPERSPLPDESRAYLRIHVGKADSEVWEWYNDLSANNRLIQVARLMKQLAWE